jgi:hypothetical protein
LLIHDAKMSLTATCGNGTSVLTIPITNPRIDQDDAPTDEMLFQILVESQDALLEIPEMHLVHVDLSLIGNEARPNGKNLRPGLVSHCSAARSTASGRMVSHSK